MNIFQILSSVLGILLFIPLARKIWVKEVEQNLATFILWGSFDAVAAISIFVQGGNHQLPAAYTAGSILIIFCILVKQGLKWSKFETMACIPVTGCLVGWFYSGPYMATILSTAGVFIGGLPQVRDSFMEPEKSPMMLYVGFTTANILSTIGGSAWSVEERLYPFSASILCSLIVLVSLRRTNQAVS